MELTEVDMGKNANTLPSTDNESSSCNAQQGNDDDDKDQRLPGEYPPHASSSGSDR